MLVSVTLPCAGGDSACVALVIEQNTEPKSCPVPVMLT